MNYQEALEKMQQLTKFGFNLGLERITELLKMLGNPERDFPVIHIGGTNGKGSTSAMVASILHQTGKRVGLFTSPHLHSYTERIKINGREIPPADFASLLSNMIPLLTEMVDRGFEHPTEFEVNTAMALLYFSRQNVDIVVLEVGLGGAIDSTNVVEPLISVITNVTMEHMEYLGNTVEKIATVKSGIIKEGRPVVTADNQPEVVNIIKERAAELKAPFYQTQQLVQIQLLETSLKGQRFNATLPQGQHLEALEIPLLGEYQLINCATALAVIYLLKKHWQEEVSEEAIRSGLAQVYWPGRMEIFGDKPKILIDGAHNSAGVAVLTRALQNNFSYSRLFLVLGMLADKEREKSVAMLAPLAFEIIITKPSSPRVGQWQQLAEMARSYCKRVQVVEDPKEALARARLLASSDDLICATGSLYMIADIRNSLL